jgi:hypothetical protein
MQAVVKSSSRRRYFIPAPDHRYPGAMSRRMLLAGAITVLGAILTLVNLRHGIAFSFPLLLGLLLLADGILRFYMLAADADAAAEQQADTTAERDPVRTFTTEDTKHTER